MAASEVSEPARRLGESMDPAVVSQIDARLDDVRHDHGVTVAWAVESGSRAWGFPSPDSDYDCRFLYVRRTADYLSPWIPRDVIETPLDQVLDVNGWDVRKSFALMVRGNATVLEWLRSPLVYRGHPAFRSLLLNLAAELVEPELLRRHYAHLGQQQWNRANLGAGGTVRLKSVFYALRPAATLHWLAEHPSPGALPPMRLQDLLAEATPSPSVMQIVQDLVERKCGTRELGTGPVPQELLDFIGVRIFDPSLEGTGRRSMELGRARDIAAEGFREVLRRFEPGN